MSLAIVQSHLIIEAEEEMKSFPVQNIFISGLALFAVIVYFIVTVGSLGHTTFDDAYMITRYAKHWLAGDGFSWNTIDGPVYGVTSPIYLIVITIVLGLTGWSDATALTLTSFVAGLMSVVMLVLMGFAIQDGKNSKISWLPLLVVPALLFLQPFRIHSISGMETTFSLLANSILAFSIVAVIRWRNTATLLLCLIAGLISLETRPDNGLYALFLPPLFFIATDKGLWNYALRYAILFAALVLCILLINRFFFGDFLPLSFFAKATGFYKGYVGATQWNNMKEMLCFYTAAAPFLMAIVCIASKRVLPQLISITLVIVITFVYLGTVTQIMGKNARYYYPSLAFVVLAAFTAAFPQSKEGKMLPSIERATDLKFLLCLMVLLPALSESIKNKASDLWEKHVIGKPSMVRGSTEYRSAANHPLPKLGWWNSTTAMADLIKYLPEGTVITASEHGFIGSRFPKLTIIDLVGLHDRTIAHRGFDIEYILSRKPDLIWFPHEDYTGIIAGILDHPNFQRDYEYYPGAYDYGIALRKSSPKYDTIKEAVAKEFLRLYAVLNLASYTAYHQQKEETKKDKNNNHLQ